MREPDQIASLYSTLAALFWVAFVSVLYILVLVKTYEAPADAPESGCFEVTQWMPLPELPKD
jgi:hypothetical protein